jgi:hypothetical protein
MKTLSSVSISVFALVLICFFLPFADIQCSGHKTGTVTGFQLVTGGEMQNQCMDSEPMAVLAFLACIVGLILSFPAAKQVKAIPMLAGFIGGILLLMLKSKLDGDALDEGMGLITVDYQLGFWGSVTLLFIAAALNLFALLQADSKT